MKRSIALLLALVLLAATVSCRQNDPQTPTVSSPSSSSIPSSSEAPSSSELSSSQGSSESESSSELPSSSDTASSQPNEAEPQPSEPTVPVPTPTPQPEPDTYSYKNLTDTQKIYYKSIYAAAKGMQAGWITLGKATDDYRSDIAVARNAVSLDCPEIFWLPSYYATAVASANGEQPVAVMYFSRSPEEDPSYLVSRSEKERMEKELEGAVKKICAQVTATDPYEIELQLHDILCQYAVYSTDPSDPMIYTAYGALVNGRAVCEGYARAMQLLLNRFNIPSVLMTGVANNEGHMWNAVLLDGKWYHLDVTWNDTQDGFISHEYFNLSDKKILLDHTVNKNFGEIDKEQLASGKVSFNIGAPACEGTRDYYFNRTGFIYAPEGEAALAEFIVSREGKTTEVAFSDNAFRDLFGLDSQKHIAEINRILLEKHKDFDFRVGSFSVSTSTLMLILETST